MKTYTFIIHYLHGKEGIYKIYRCSSIDNAWQRVIEYHISVGAIQGVKSFELQNIL